MNAPQAFESYLILEGEKRVEITRDARQPNTCTYIFNKEDHTIGNLIKHQLLKDPEVVYAGYRVPHPLEHKVIIRLQTTGKISPNEAIQQAFADLMQELQSVDDQFMSGIEKAKEAD